MGKERSPSEPTKFERLSKLYDQALQRFSVWEAALITELFGLLAIFALVGLCPVVSYIARTPWSHPWTGCLLDGKEVTIKPLFLSSLQKLLF
jgi:hypothetical protein